MGLRLLCILIFESSLICTNSFNHMANSHCISFIFKKQDTNYMYPLYFCKNICIYLDTGKRDQKRVSKKSGNTLMISVVISNFSGIWMIYPVFYVPL